ncbi:peptidoglycan bridge formation glycyltransferase FemA/FemB family protein [Candidatus Nomurabacteria bacterium]|uniref:Peptidoglycan bridge formation glycyltransferase FemA/FemB family protein n=1 Tax=candidate division WWE3 bacterium TaxID=2053526 RepID=A0A955IVY7_UNCKA|nr:peptidoglycan bridge formation glycyltransferase FemA/FemB family protein [candidate division WWE3 bacterium]MCB9823483.1 peptidoglycan bridge formation glycyltransferase FemA/FemB family protein [Candidatus Nomurabacteria bacterium]MCB9827765.1 peptidoglycan bridge formation glycyltransferase FemA/FemB family protein [Candidatus Nomurabacteria bacterium]HXK52370.1 peptidoglycan bridge formation glycyltransferase FemA/FemB family protein [bacterium]
MTSAPVDNNVNALKTQNMVERAQKTHILQTDVWGDFKTAMGTKAIRVAGVQYTLHRLPKTNIAYAYCPKVNPKNIIWEELEKSLISNRCFAIKFDVPNIISTAANYNNSNTKELEIFTSKKGCIKTYKSTITQNNVLLNIEEEENKLLSNMHPKHRYNIKYAQKKGVQVRITPYNNYDEQAKRDFEIFWNLQKETRARQNFLTHSKNYFEKAFETLGKQNAAFLITAEYRETPLTSWMVFIKDGTLYYPYGGSSEKYRNFQASTLTGWEAITLGKKFNCDLFDMWGACKDLTKESDPEVGFTTFKIRYGGTYVRFIDSYDYVLNKPIYHAFKNIYPKVLGGLKFAAKIKNLGKTS